ncbi:MAG: UDP-glucose 4-epimerase, partial [Clostridiales bacterium]|nr:UDP-glucose 4-epimerase [Clostridiales bacterium]
MGAVLVTGGAGFIGSHTCVELLDAGYEIIVMDNFANSKPESLNRIKKITGKDFKFYQTDMLDFDGMAKIFSENKIDAVIHFAGLKAVGESVSKPLEYYHNNIAGTLELLRAMRQYGCKKIVFSSSATVYGMNNPVPYKEDYPTSATNPYGYTKVMIEQILKDICHADKEWSAVLLRYFNPIGAHSSGLIGEDPNGIPNNLFPYIAQVATGKLPKLNVYGNDYPTPDGTGVRDYIHVVDLAKGHLCALDYAMKHSGAEAVNLGTGKGSSVLEVVAAFEKACGKAIPKEFAPRRAGDIATCYADTSKAKE